MASERELKVLGAVLSGIQDDALASRRAPATSERLAAVYQARAQRALARRQASRWGAAALVALAAAVLFGISFRPRPLGFVVGTAKEPGQLGAWVVAIAPESRDLSFSDGSQLNLQAGAQARVLSTNEHGARVVLERGKALVHVVPRANNDWYVVGGPFEIHVTGTSFEASWEPEQQQLRIVMREGHVLIRGECLGALRALGKGESATLSCLVPNAASALSASGTQSMSWPPTAAVAVPVAPSLPHPEATGGLATPAPAPALSEASPSASRASGSADSAADWEALARQGNYKAAHAAAERAGFEQLCEVLPASELLELATTARLAPSAGHAQAAYLAVRRRFTGSDQAASAAFHLGQLAFDGRGAYAEAERWFATYLSERPSGTLAAESLGRKMEAEQRGEDANGARGSAQQYLERYPIGAHARLARSLLAP